MNKANQTNQEILHDIRSHVMRQFQQDYSTGFIRRWLSIGFRFPAGVIGLRGGPSSLGYFVVGLMLFFITNYFALWYFFEQVVPSAIAGAMLLSFFMLLPLDLCFGIWKRRLLTFFERHALTVESIAVVAESIRRSPEATAAVAKLIEGDQWLAYARLYRALDEAEATLHKSTYGKILDEQRSAFAASQR